METLPRQAVHVWYTLTSRELEEPVRNQYLALLAPEERARHERFVQEKDRRQYLLGKVLVRSVLSRYHPRPPQSWTFQTSAHGKPALSETLDQPLCFNLSHTDGLVACAFTREGDVGIDVETLRRSVSLDLARRYFAPAEVALLERIPEAQWKQFFFRFWTLKEAYVKARGMGLTLPLEQFAFELHDDHPPRITFEPSMNDDPAAWRFFMPPVPSEHHQMAVAVHCAGEVQLVMRQWDLS